MNFKYFASRTLLAGALGSLLGLGTGCPKKPTYSPEYAKARDRFAVLLAQKGDDVYGEAEMSSLLATLDAVPKDSLSSGAATDLAAKIRAGQKSWTKANNERKLAMARLNQPVPVPTFGTSGGAAKPPSNPGGSTETPVLAAASTPDAAATTKPAHDTVLGVTPALASALTMKLNRWRGNRSRQDCCMG